MSLFSAIDLGPTEFATHWGSLLPELRKRFPLLKFENPADLHITIIFMGPKWDSDKVPQMEEHALQGPANYPLILEGAPALFGRDRNILALRLNRIEDEWSQRVIDARRRLTALGLRNENGFDQTFDPHLTLARAKKPGSKRELRLFSEWLNENASRLDDLKIEITRELAPKFLVTIQGRQKDRIYFPLNAKG